MSPYQRRTGLQRVRDHWGILVWLVVVWVLLWGEVSVANVVAGTVVAFVVVMLLSLPSVDFHGRVRPLWLIRMLLQFVADLFVASFQVAFQALRFGHTPQGAVIGVHLRSESDLYEVLTAELTALVPGTIVVDAHRQSRTLYIHVLDVAGAGGVEAARASVLATELRVLRALASEEELDAAGVPVPGRGGLLRRHDSRSSVASKAAAVRGTTDGGADDSGAGGTAGGKTDGTGGQG